MMEIEDIKRLVVNPGDTLVVRYGGRLNKDQRDALMQNVVSNLDIESVKVLVLDSGLTMDVICSSECA